MPVAKYAYLQELPESARLGLNPRPSAWEAEPCVAHIPCYTVTVANLTLTIADEVLLRARRRALDHGTSVNALVRGYLESFAGADGLEEAGRALVALAERSSGSSGPDGRSWTRDDLHER